MLLGAKESGAIVVTSTADSTAVGTLRRALIDANLAAGLDTITFNIPGPGPHVIQLLSPLPQTIDPLSDQVIIDGTTQPGYAGTPIIVLDGSLAGPGVAGAGVNGLDLSAGGSTVRGLVIRNFSGHGINIDTFGGNTIEGNRIEANGGSGVLIFSSSNNLIGGLTAAARNVISGNGSSGVEILGLSATNRIQGNYLGTDASGSAAVPNGLDGILIFNSSGNVIGGTVGGARNIISGNTNNGVELLGGSATGNLVQGNYIGTDVTGTKSVRNSIHGVLIFNAAGNTIGGTAPAARNIISGNGINGLEIFSNLTGPNSTSNRIQGNFIGTDRTGTLPLSNGEDGVLIFDSSSNIVGGTATGARNIISGNGAHGVEIIGTATGPGSTLNLVQGNFIGTDVYGTSALGNRLDGVLIFDASTNTIGGAVTGARNIISANGANGVEIFSSATGPGSSSNLVQGNFIGTDVSGTRPLGNSQLGVDVATSPNNTLLDNLVAFNLGAKTPAPAPVASGGGGCLVSSDGDLAWLALLLFLLLVAMGVSRARYRS
jgi:parallel beta-helix repeat protein